MSNPALEDDGSRMSVMVPDAARHGGGDSHENVEHSASENGKSSEDDSNKEDSDMEDIDKEDSDIEMDDRFSPEADGPNEDTGSDEWDEDAKYALAVQYRRHKKKFWTKISDELDFPWRQVEAMHFQLGKENLSSRADESSRNPTTSDRIINVLREINYFRNIFYYNVDEPHEPLTYPRLLDSLAGISISTTELIAQVESSPGPWSPRVIRLMERMVHDLWILVSDELPGANFNPNMGDY
ncbi:uncharacterized protein GIQ15_04689 [Arthroderma uncinatum]|uniref:uncharacterized protein n=1 Tax=Arthroderma uncinatum TaxID=74035 RepID=UPI00144A82B6|nr:uncharacterized protein GIQ15_04689 [Arthroderma uncinatum]KAF3481930.1 hypothetical protein GIQ15_04689 [Arthroderma uncinatum]